MLDSPVTAASLIPSDISTVIVSLWRTLASAAYCNSRYHPLECWPYKCVVVIVLCNFSVWQTDTLGKLVCHTVCIRCWPADAQSGQMQWMRWPVQCISTRCSLCNMHHIYFNTLPRVWCCCGHQKCAAVDLFQIEYNTNDTLSAVHHSAGPQCILARYRRMMQRPTDTLSHKHPKFRIT